MIRLIKRTIDWLKTIFKGGSMSFEFPDIDIADVKKKIDFNELPKLDAEGKKF